MTHTSSQILQKGIEEILQQMADNVCKDKGYGKYRRRAEEKCPGAMMTYQNPIYGYPDLVISGTTEATVAQHRWLLDYLCSHMMEDIALIPASDYVDILNLHLIEMGMGSSYKAVLINADQFLHGYGLNLKRYYVNGGIDLSELVFIQIVEVDTVTGCFPAISTMSQVLFATVPFGQKEALNENLPPVQNIRVHSGTSATSH